jgi:hypothetical protein
LPLGHYDNFPANIHHIASYISSVSIKQLQQKLIQLLGDLNRKEFTFEEIVIPTIPQGKVIFEFGLADSGGFNFIDEAEVKKALGLLAKQQIQSLDFFCAIRYYKGKGANKTALKFDYYMIRTIFNKGTLEVQVFHERGPRYISPEEVSSFIFLKINESATKKILKEQDI